MVAKREKLPTGTSVKHARRGEALLKKNELGI